MRRASLVVAAVLFHAVPAAAQQTEAARLFDEGVSLLDQGRVSEACPKLEASRKLEPAAGTLLNLAGCYERAGRRGRALATFRDALDASRARGRADWQKVAEEHIKRLSATMPKLTVQRGPTPGPVEVTLDGAVLRDADLGVPRAVESGSHTVVAKSAGRQPFSNLVVVTADATVAIPLLRPEETTARREEPAEPSAGVPPRQIAGLAGMVAGGIGIVVAGIGAIVAGNALDEARESCPVYPTQCSRAAADPNDRADTWSTIATAAGIGGLVVGGAGALLFFWPSSSPKGPRASFDGTRVLVGGRF